jgi:hypothetical protein
VVLGRPNYVRFIHVMRQFQRQISMFRGPGGYEMFTRRARLARPDCEHEKTVTIRNAGIERTVCESCGHVGIGVGRTDRHCKAKPVQSKSERASAPVG